jgi:FlaA1/EpsC-like NDP-sugar epimerase
MSAFRNRHVLLVDLLALPAVPFIALLLHFEGVTWPAGFGQAAIVFAVVATPARMGVAWTTGIYSSLWQLASINEVGRILRAGALAAAVSVLLGAVVLPATGLMQPMPLSVLAIDAMLALGVLASPRLGLRFLSNRRDRDATHARTLVVGAGVAGQMIARESTSNPRAGFEVVAFVDDDPHKLGAYLNGILVAGKINDLPTLVRDLLVQDVVIAMPSARGQLVRRVVEMASHAGARTRIVPSLTDIVAGRIETSQLRPVEIEDLLRRTPVQTDLAAVRTLAQGRVVLVTGAGGSIGSELCRQIADLEPAALLVLDHSENQIFEIEGELRRRTPALKIVPIIADIRDSDRIGRVFDKYRPHAVFHAAAHKHVPLMEENVVEAVTNNVAGTRNVVEASLGAGTEHFVLISTDKAVRPTSIMGASKRVAEMVVRRAAARSGKHFVAVRFGNVLGSRGSVVPTFLAQIKRGGPVTVTHPEMRRYFMTIPEAVQLVLQAGVLGVGGELLVLDMGEPVKIVDLARDLIRLSGLEEGLDVEIKYTGLRPGEKLYEEVLFGTEDISPTEHPKVIRALAEIPPESIDGQVDELIRLARLAPDEEGRIRAAVEKLVPDYARTEEKRDAQVIPLRKSQPGDARRG